MKNFPGKIVALFIAFIIIGCNSCPPGKNDFVNQLQTINKVKEIVIKNTLEEIKQYQKQEIQKLVNKEDFDILNDLRLDNVYKIRNVLVFTFKHPYEKTWLDNEFNENMKSCITHLIYGENVDEKNDILSYPRYAECRYEKENIDNKWTYVFQKWYCAD